MIGRQSKRTKHVLEGVGKGFNEIAVHLARRPSLKEGKVVTAKTQALPVSEPHRVCVEDVRLALLDLKIQFCLKTA